MTQYQHTSWSGAAGAPSEVRAIVQTAEGFLWLATPEGLIRFDGVSFRPIGTLGGQPLGSLAVEGLCADATGGIWVSMGGNAALYKHGILTTFKARIVTMCAEVNGVTWLRSNGRLVRFKDGKFDEDDAAWGLQGSLPSSLFVDKQSTIWTFDEASSTLSYLSRGDTRFRLLKTTPERPMAAVMAPDGTMLGGTSSGLVRVAVNLRGTSPSILTSRRAMTDPFFDRQGGFWAADIHGLIHASSLSAVHDDPDGERASDDAMTVQQGLSSDVVWTIFEDREGNIWVGTGGGLDRFRDTAFVPIKLPGRALPFALAAVDEGGVMSANWNTPPLHVDEKSRTHKPILGADPPTWGFSTLFRDTDGTVWFSANGDELWHRSKKGAWSFSRIPTELEGQRVDAMARDTSGALWVASGGSAAIIRLKEGRWSQPGGPGLPAKWVASHIAADHEGRIWSAQQERVIAFDGIHGATFDKVSHGLDVGNVTAFFERGPGSHMWVGGISGVAAFDGRRFHTLGVEGEAAPAQISGILEASNGDLWLNCRGGGFRIGSDELKKFFANPDVKVVARHFDVMDGLPGLAPAAYGEATVAEGRDGIVWMSSKFGVAYFDSKRKLPAAPSPGVYIESISTPEARKSVGSSTIVLPPLSRSVEIGFTATGLGLPDRIRFRYRLDGVDEGWRASDFRRVASYADLSPGFYRFHVMSTDESGTWAGDESTVEFRVLPAWFQTWIFRAAAAFLFLTAAWLAYRARVGHLTARIRWQMKTQQAERERIARELHDTLLQGVHGLIWRFQTLSSRLAASDPVRNGLEAALDTAEALLVESRDRVQDLREPSRPTSSLMDQLREIGEGMAMDQPSIFASSMTGVERDINPMASRQILDIAREALSNAFTHSGAARVEMRVEFGRRHLELEIRDDGGGIEPAVRRNGKSLHFGLTGMRERARDLHALFELSSNPKEGTKIRLKVKASIAYLSQAATG